VAPTNCAASTIDGSVNEAIRFAFMLDFTHQSSPINYRFGNPMLVLSYKANHSQLTRSIND
jgi:hypothetical protein